MKKGVLRNFTKFTGKQLSQSLFFNKVADLRAATLLNKKYNCTGPPTFKSQKVAYQSNQKLLHHC